MSDWPEPDPNVIDICDQCGGVGLHNGYYSECGPEFYCKCGLCWTGWPSDADKIRAKELLEKDSGR